MERRERQGKKTRQETRGEKEEHPEHKQAPQEETTGKQEEEEHRDHGQEPQHEGAERKRKTEDFRLKFRLRRTGQQKTEEEEEHQGHGWAAQDEEAERKREEEDFRLRFRLRRGGRQETKRKKQGSPDMRDTRNENKHEHQGLRIGDNGSATNACIEYNGCDPWKQEEHTRGKC